MKQITVQAPAENTPETAFKWENLIFLDARDDQFLKMGLCSWDKGDLFRRIPEKAAKSVSEGVAGVGVSPSGGRIRFLTDSSFLTLSATFRNVFRYGQDSASGTGGFDLYEYKDGEYRFEDHFVPPAIIDRKYEADRHFNGKRLRDLTLYFPIYNSVEELFLGLEKGSTLICPDPSDELPVVFYGSSVTQGGCATRPGNTYEALLSRKLGFDFINLGMAGCARGETAMAEYIASLKMRAFVYDYDFNAPNAEHLEKTHEPFFRIIREKQPDLPILILSMFYRGRIFGEDEREAVIRRTYENAIAAGDRNVYFLSGADAIAADSENAGVIEGVHPNDLGFKFIADGMTESMKKLLIL